MSQQHQSASRRVTAAALGRARGHDSLVPVHRGGNDEDAQQHGPSQVPRPTAGTADGCSPLASLASMPRSARVSRGAAASLKPTAELGAPPMAAKRPRALQGSLGGISQLPAVPLSMATPPEEGDTSVRPAAKRRKEGPGILLGGLSQQTPLPAAAPSPLPSSVKEDAVGAHPAAKRLRRLGSLGLNPQSQPAEAPSHPAAKRPRGPGSLGLNPQSPPAEPPPPAKRMHTIELQEQRGSAPVAAAKRRRADPPLPALAPAQGTAPTPPPASAPISAPALPPAPASAPACAPIASLLTAPLLRLAEAVQRSASGSTGSEGGSGSGGVIPSSDVRQLLQAAIHVCFGQSMLEEPRIREMLLSQMLERCSAAQSLLLPLLVGAVSVLPKDDVAVIQRDIGIRGEPPGEGSEMLQTRVQLLIWTIGAACPSEAQDTASSCRSSLEAYLMMEVAVELDARVEGLGDPTPVLQATFREVLKQQQLSQPLMALVVVAACLAHARQGRVGDEEGSAETRVTGQLMRLVGRAMDAEGGSGFSALATATRAMQVQGELPEPPSVPDAVTAAAFVSIKAALPDLEGLAGVSFRQLFKPAIALGVALYSVGCVDLVGCIRMALILAYGPAWRLPLQVAAAVVAESMAPGGPPVELVMQLMGAMRGMTAATV